MIRKNISSSDISSIGFEPQSQTLEIEFKSGGIFQYFEVSENIYNTLVNSISIGKYFNQYIKGQYNYKKLN